MSETKINVSQTTITAEAIGAAGAVDTMPTASATTVGKIVQYTGTTTSNYTNGFFYKGVSQESSSYEIEDLSFDSEMGVAPSCSEEDFAEWFFSFAHDGDLPLTACAYVSFQLEDGGEWYAHPDSGDGDYFGEWSGTQEDLEQAGFVFPTDLGEPLEYFRADFTVTGGEGTTTNYSWEQVNVQPEAQGGVTSVNGRTGAVVVSEVPSMSNQSGKFLTTNGSSASWAVVPTLPSQTGNAGKFLHTNGTTASWQVAGSSLPSQAGQAGKFLTTNGSAASWATIAGNEQRPPLLDIAGEDGPATEGEWDLYGWDDMPSGGCFLRTVSSTPSVGDAVYYWDDIGGYYYPLSGIMAGSEITQNIPFCGWVKIGGSLGDGRYFLMVNGYRVPFVSIGPQE